MATYTGTAGDDFIRGTRDDDIINGNDGNDTLYGENGPDTINGGNGNDTIFGGGNPDTITTGTGTDIVFGQDGNDVITGGVAGSTDLVTIDGGTDDDRFNIYTPNFSLQGGDGYDRFFAYGIGVTLDLAATGIEEARGNGQYVDIFDASSATLDVNCSAVMAMTASLAEQATIRSTARTATTSSKGAKATTPSTPGRAETA